MILFCEECGEKNSIPADITLVQEGGYTCQHCGFFSPLNKLPGILPLLSGDSSLARYLMIIREELEEIIQEQAEKTFLNGGTTWLQTYKPTILSLTDLVDILGNAIANYEQTLRFREKLAERIDLPGLLD